MQARSYTIRVLELLAAAPSLTVRDVAELLGIDIVRAKDVLERLRYNGYVERIGKGYSITEKGRSFLASNTRRSTPLTSFTEDRGGKEKSESEGGGEKVEAVAQAASSGSSPSVDLEGMVNSLAARVDELINRLKELEARIKDVESRVASLESFARELGKRKELVVHEAKGFTVMETPVMWITEAQSKLGQLLEKFLMEGKLIRVGSLIVDPVFYEEFKRKFPIKASEVDKLASAERILLEEMRKEMIVILHAGREYRLVGTG
ncbi:MAG: Mn-dependent transcriptional regulator [Desulfurococcus sp.]|nr:Mn-dependent transcriptional regulator [Desulfurococcus sp.]